MEQTIAKIREAFESFLQNANAQLDKSNKAAGLRARRISLELEPLLKRFRKQSLDKSNATKPFSHAPED